MRNTVWLTADVHYTAAHHYDPQRAAFKDFDALLGVRLRPAERRPLRPEHAGRHLRPAGGVLQGAAGRAGQPVALCRAAVLRRGRHRRAQRRADGATCATWAVRRCSARRWRRDSADAAPARQGHTGVTAGDQHPGSCRPRMPAWTPTTRPATCACARCGSPTCTWARPAARRARCWTSCATSSARRCTSSATSSTAGSCAAPGTGRRRTTTWCRRSCARRARARA